MFSWLLGDYCTVGGHRIPKDQVTKYYRGMDRTWHKVCTKHFKGVPVQNRKPGTQHVLKPNHEKKKTGQGTLW